MRQIGIVCSGFTVITRTNMQVCRIKLTTKNTIIFLADLCLLRHIFFSMSKISGTDFRQMLLCRLRRDLWELIFVFDEISVVDGGPGHHGGTRCPEKRTWILNRVFDELINRSNRPMLLRTYLKAPYPISNYYLNQLGYNELQLLCTIATGFQFLRYKFPSISNEDVFA